MSGQTTMRQNVRTTSRPTTHTHSRQQTARRFTFQTRYRLVIGAALIGLFALVVGSQTVDIYDGAYRMFRSIVQDNGVRVDASEQALQHIAGASTAAADFSSTTAGGATHQAALTTLYDEFRQFRDNMFILRSDLDSAESSIYAAIEHAVYDEFWPQIGIVIAAEQVGDHNAARAAYVKADNTLEAEIVPALQRLETANFAAMKDAERQAGSRVEIQAWVLGSLLLGLAVSVTAFSIWLRKKVRRYLTPGLDAALLLSWLLLFGVFTQLIGLPETLRSMVEDAYYSVTASSRVLQAAEQGNRAESGALLDLEHVTRWQSDFDADKHAVELMLCGADSCLSNTFVVGQDTVSRPVAARAKAISATDSAYIGGIVPLIANVTYTGEARTLETARAAYNDYLLIDGRTRVLIVANQIAQALALNTGTQPGQSDEAFSRFAAAIEAEKSINRTVFESIWHDQQYWLPTNRLALGIGAPTLLIVLLAVGVIHRYREL